MDAMLSGATQPCKDLPKTRKIMTNNYDKNKSCMSIEIKSTKKDMTAPKLVMTIYGSGGVGKTTLATTAPKPVFIDAEDGTKALGARDIDVDVVNVDKWSQVGEAYNAIEKADKYETVIIDPTGELMRLLIEEVAQGGHVQLQDWGIIKKRFRKFIWTLKRSGFHVLFIAHEKEQKDDQLVLKRPDVSANMSTELVNLSDVVGHMKIDMDGNRVLRVQPEKKAVAKDRFDVFDETIEDPNITDMIEQIHAMWTTEGGE